MLYLNEHQSAVAGKVWEFPFSGFLILPVVEGSAAKMAGDECLKRAGRSGPPVRDSDPDIRLIDQASFVRDVLKKTRSC
ncbi:MAG: hypothetical protein QOJ86_3108 [Bradyrhizobium sp.]|jgi:hypothetical protein|nr:hypothetical protein [Bradyrhizobium sp.]